MHKHEASPKLQAYGQTLDLIPGVDAWVLPTQMKYEPWSGSLTRAAEAVISRDLS